MSPAGAGITDRSKRWPNRSLFIGCVVVGATNLLLLDFYLAPAVFANDAQDSVTATMTAPSITTRSSPAPLTSATVAHAAPAAPAHVPTIVARFQSSSTEPLSDATIRLLATSMIADHGSSIVLEGHSETGSGDERNRAVSLDRAKWIKARLIAWGVSDERIETVGLGATRPLPSDERDDPSANGRVEVRWVGTTPSEGEARK